MGCPTAHLKIEKGNNLYKMKRAKIKLDFWQFFLPDILKHENHTLNMMVEMLELSRVFLTLIRFNF